MTGEPGNVPVQQSDPAKAVRIMADTSNDFFRCYVGNCTEKPLLRAYIEHEAQSKCRRDRIGKANERIQELGNAE